jgi:hypothetical protein
MIHSIAAHVDYRNFSTMGLSNLHF